MHKVGRKDKNDLLPAKLLNSAELGTFGIF